MAITCNVTCRGHFEALPLDQVLLDDIAEKLSNGEIESGELVVEMLEGATWVGSLIVGPLFPAEPQAADGRWCVVFAQPGGVRWCLSDGGTAQQYLLYVYCGGESDIIEACAVELPLALEAVRRCCTEGRRSPDHSWVDMIQAMNL